MRHTTWEVTDVQPGPFGCQDVTIEERGEPARRMFKGLVPVTRYAIGQTISVEFPQWPHTTLMKEAAALIGAPWGLVEEWPHAQCVCAYLLLHGHGQLQPVALPEAARQLFQRDDEAAQFTTVYLFKEALRRIAIAGRANEEV